MTERDWLMLFIALEGAPDGLDPVRIQKGMFLFAMEANTPASEKYTFKPYDYGPMSAAVYADLDKLVDAGLIKRTAVPGKRWSRFRVTTAGRREGQQALDQAQAQGRLDAAQKLHVLKQHVATLPFDKLLSDVYEAYPEYAVKSVFRRSS